MVRTEFASLVDLAESPAGFLVCAGLVHAPQSRQPLPVAIFGYHLYPFNLSVSLEYPPP